MPAKVFFPDKICLFCSKSFNRWIKDGKLEPTSDFKVRKFCGAECFHKYYVGNNHPLYKEEGSRRKDGYIRISVNGERKYLHRVKKEQILRRELLSEEHVHHIDGNQDNNDPSNLIILSNSEHRKLHNKTAQRNQLGQFSKII